MNAAPPDRGGSIDLTRCGRHWELAATQWLPASPQTLWRFVGDCRHMNHVIPRSVRFEVLSPDVAPVAPGAVYDYRLRLRGVPVRWRTLITEVDHPWSFTDVQARGPYAHFEHRHRFDAWEGGTRVGDVIRYRPPGGPLAGVVNQVVARELWLLFKTRHRRLAELYTAHADGGPDPAGLL